MNCEKCQELLSDYIDGELAARESAAVTAHLAACAACAEASEEFLAIVEAAHGAREQLYDLPNERALWLRIRNTIESDAAAARPAAAAAAAAAPQGFWRRLFVKRWEFTLPQLATGVAALAVAVSLATALGVQYLETERRGEAAVRSRQSIPSPVYPQGYLQPHQASLRYWQQRVELRKASWNPRMRDSFDRSIGVLDQAVNESLTELRENPHDEVAEEMLNSALRDKIELLREFGEQ
ncbi:MAG TPA: zf-HC2 domain-containing protein [Pyrinomonadaceae bacterium]|nr:zf-HC2 domain-containing protein [Pyrinomonadaceae bacterium]